MNMTCVKFPIICYDSDVLGRSRTLIISLGFQFIMPTIVGFASSGGSDFNTKKHLPCFADNHGGDLTFDGIKEGCKTVFTMLDNHTDSDNWVDRFKDSRFFLNKQS